MPAADACGPAGVAHLSKGNPDTQQQHFYKFGDLEKLLQLGSLATYATQLDSISCHNLAVLVDSPFNLNQLLQPNDYSSNLMTNRTFTWRTKPAWPQSQPLCAKDTSLVNSSITLSHTQATHQ